MSKKIFKGYELMEKAMKGEININQKVSSLSEDYKDCELKFVLNDTAIQVMGLNLKLIEDQTIDIDSIQEIELSEYDREHYVAPIRNNADKINEVIRALKHLNKEIQSIKEK